jgi:NADH-quinone oxidoreductase subunit A
MDYLPLSIYFLLVIAMVAGIIIVSHLLGRLSILQAKLEPYECGIPPSGDAMVRFNIRFYLIGLFFLIFDMEAAFIYVWAVVFRSMGTQGLIHMTIFILVLLAGLIYIWKEGGLDFK